MKASEVTVEKVEAERTEETKSEINIKPIEDSSTQKETGESTVADETKAVNAEIKGNHLTSNNDLNMSRQLEFE